MAEIITVKTRGQGLYEISDQVADSVRKNGTRAGLCTVFIMHTSASLTIQENADPSAKRDLERWLCRLVPENDSLYTHTSEGPDDMPSHIKATLTDVSLSIPVIEGQLTLGTWQGIYVWEHRTSSHTRKVAISVVPE